MSNNNNYLWSGESVFCVCGHHVEYHKTGLGVFFWENNFYAHCNFKEKDKDNRDIDCKCQEFKPYKDEGELEFKP